MIRKIDFFADAEEFPESNRLCAALKGLAEGDTDLSFELILVDEEEIQRLNRETRNIDKVTDVLSFPTMDDIKGRPILAEEHAEELDEENRILLGSIVICAKRAKEQAEEYGHSYERELNYLAAHGVLHCLGYDHETEEQRAEMREKEEYAMQKLGLTRGI